jgi:hypothetical protein
LCRNYEIRSEVSVVADDLALSINDPNGGFNALLKNIPRSEFSTPFLLSLHIYFEALDLAGAKEVADDHLTNCLNMLAFTTGAGFRKHRIRQLVDAEKPTQLIMRDVKMWGERIEFDDPQPFLTIENAKTIEHLLGHVVPPAIKRALRWYRLGIDAASPDDQFTYFWFALEIVAEFQKPIEKVHDKCPRCQSALYCEQCEDHPVHRPYAKQAIAMLLKAADDKCDDATVALLDKTRNSLLHSATLKEIERSLPDPHEHVVNVLGGILWKALIMQFPKEMFEKAPMMGVPSTYVHYTAVAVAHIRTVVPVDKDGNFELDFKGMFVGVKPPGPPQSASPFVVRVTSSQYDRLNKLSHQNGDHQDMFNRIQVRENDGQIHARILATDISAIRQALKMEQEGEWQALFREILESTGSGDS